MDKTSTMFLRVLKAALQAEQVHFEQELPEDVWKSMVDMAIIHRVLPLFYEAAGQLLRKEQPEIAAKVKQQVMYQIAKQTRKTCEFLDLYEKFLKANIHPVVVKGIICRNLYPNPDLRQSLDEDILVPVELLDETERILNDFGMYTQQNLHTAFYEASYHKKGSPLVIEMHRSLFDTKSDACGDMNCLFEEIQTRQVAATICGTTIYTLKATDHLLFLICHGFKHFIYSGFGIRQVCDIVLFANHYGSRIDWNRLLEDCRKIRAEKFAAALFQIGSQYLTFDPEMAACPKAWMDIRVDAEPLLEDLLSGGLYGDSSMSRKHSSNITLSAVASRKQGKKEKHGVLASVFPGAKQLERRYPYLREHAWLLPVAWGQRLWTYSREKDSNAAQALKIGKERIELLKEYGIVE